MSKLALPKGKKVTKPTREPDMISKRGVPYWFGPEWVREVNNTIARIKPIKKSEDWVCLHMVAKNGNVSYIRGSIQEEFQKWHEDNQIDAILLGIDEDEILLTDWDYE